MVQTAGTNGRNVKEHFSSAPLTPEENEEVRRIIESDKRLKYIMAGARQIALWVTAIIVAIIASKNFIFDLLAWKHQ